MHILLNGKSLEFSPSLTLADVLREAGFAGKRVAIEVNREIVPKSQHDRHVIVDGDRIEIILAIGGG